MISVNILNVIKLSGIILGVIMLSLLNVIMMSFLILSVVRLNVMAPKYFCLKYLKDGAYYFCKTCKIYKEKCMNNFQTRWQNGVLSWFLIFNVNLKKIIRNH